jgi:hypothetical protein
MPTNSQASAPLGWPAQAGLVLGGALAVRLVFVATDSYSAASLLAAVFLLVLVGLQRRQGARSSAGVLKTWRDVPASAVRLAVAIGVLAVLAAGALRTMTDPGWAAVAVFIGAAMIIDCLVRMGATRAQDLGVRGINARRLEP